MVKLVHISELQALKLAEIGLNVTAGDYKLTELINQGIDTNSHPYEILLTLFCALNNLTPSQYQITETIINAFHTQEVSISY